MTKGTKTIEDTILELEQRIQELKKDTEQADSSAKIEELEKERTGLQKEMYSNLTPYEIVKIARHHL
ncbi:MAG: acetyl-CoA carboxylase carboxyl transferase subunit alpha, partial [Candidatus Brocadiales bacterium]|nr:acetyl-CoA carboxylase carboxyl transferase subunit alpha [Candidatus Brocadiales bacterium]